MSDEILHSARGPSGAHRWRRCPGSINAERELPDKVGREAAEGTVFHTYAALCVEFGFQPEYFPVGRVHKVDGHEIVFDSDMQHYMHAGLDWIAEHVGPDDILIVEQRVSIAPWAGPGEFGTADVAIIKVADRRIINFDWKYGKGVVVSPVKNDQMYLYSLGVWNDHAKVLFDGVDPVDIKVNFYIEQPRAPGGGGEWETTMEEILAEGAFIYADALESMNPNAIRVPGEKQCQFCRASGKCPEQQAYLLDIFGMKYDDIELGLPPILKPAESLTLEARSYILLHWPAFQKYVKAIHALTLHDLRAGKEVPLLKAVVGQPGNRFYPDPDAAGLKLEELVGKDHAYVTKPISPPEAEKLIGKPTFKREMKGLYDQPPGKPKLVHQDDKRPAIQDFSSKLEDLDDEEDGNGDE